MLKLFRGLDGFDQCPSNTSTRTENDRHAGLGKRPKANVSSQYAFGFELPRHRLLTPPMTA